MKDFKKLIKESHLGNPLNEVDNSKTVSTKHLDAIIYGDGGIKLRINSSNKSPYGYTKRDLIKSPFGVPDEEFTFDYIKKEIDEVYIKFPDEEIKELLNKVDQYKNSLNEEDRATRVDRIFAGDIEIPEFDPKDVLADLEREKNEEEINEENEKFDKIAKMEYGKPWMELSIAQKQEMLSYMNRETEKQFQTDYERRRRGDYSDDMEDGMTDYQRGRMDEGFKKGDKVTYLGNPAEITFVGKDQMDRTYYSVSYDKGRGKTKASNLYNKDGEIKAIKEDINDPVLMKTRAAQMKRDAMDSKRISAEKAMDLRYELSILDNEREDILMRIEDIGVEIEQTAEPEGGPIADELGGRLMTAEKELRAIDNQIIDIKDDLGYFDMNESIPNMEEDLEVDIETDPNKERLKVKIPGDFSDNEGEAAVKKELEKQNKVFKSFSVKDIKELPEGNGGAKQDDEKLSLDVSSDAALDNEVEKMGYSESLQKSLREKLQERLK